MLQKVKTCLIIEKFKTTQRLNKKVNPVTTVPKL